MIPASSYHAGPSRVRKDVTTTSLHSSQHGEAVLLVGSVELEDLLLLLLLPRVVNRFGFERVRRHDAHVVESRFLYELQHLQAVVIGMGGMGMMDISMDIGMDIGMDISMDISMDIGMAMGGVRVRADVAMEHDIYVLLLAPGFIGWTPLLIHARLLRTHGNGGSTSSIRSRVCSSSSSG